MFDNNKISVQLMKICECLGGILTHKKIDEHLTSCGIEINAVSSQQVSVNGISGYTVGTNKKDKIYNSLAKQINKTNSVDCVIQFIESVFDLTQFSGDIISFNEAKDNINRILYAIGYEVSDSGKVCEVEKAKSIDEIEERVNKLQKEVKVRRLHNEILKYCLKEYLDKDYFHAQFEAVKGLFERIRQMTKQHCDNKELLDRVFSTSAPMLMIRNSNILSSQTDRDEFLGIKYLAEGLGKLIRNPKAHTPRILSNDELTDCLETFSILSKVHRYLDECIVTGCAI